MIAVFKDHENRIFHNEFQEWRRNNPSAYFLTMKTQVLAVLHAATCFHSGSCDSTQEDFAASLTRKRKICAASTDLLLSWAGENQIEVAKCAHCLNGVGNTARAVAEGGETTLDRSDRATNQHSFRHAEVFPLIVGLFVQARGDSDGYVSHEDVVAAMLSDVEAARVVANARLRSALPDDQAVASNMVAWFSQQITTGASPWAMFFDRQRCGGTWAYRPKTATASPIAPDIDLSAIEGEPRMFFHVRRERDPALAEAKRTAMRAALGHLECEACGLSSEARYPGLVGEVCEVHHRRPLSQVAEPVETRLDDLAILCANCHRAIHQTRPLMAIEEFMSTFQLRSVRAG